MGAFSRRPGSEGNRLGKFRGWTQNIFKILGTIYTKGKALKRVTEVSFGIL